MHITSFSSLLSPRIFARALHIPSARAHAKVVTAACTALIATAALSTAAFGYEIKPADSEIRETDNIRILQSMSKGVAELSAEASKSIVFVSVSKTVKSGMNGINPFDFFFGPGRGQQPQEREYKQKGLGSGFIIDLDKGYILSNNHVIADADEITVKLANGQTYDAKVKGRDKNTDVAVIEITDKDYDKSGLGELRLGNSDDVTVGEFVIAMGAPFGLEASLTLGVLSATGRGALNITTLGNFMQTDAAINPGNSGGPLINTKGHVIGINTAIYSKSGGSAGIGFAVPANLVRKVATQLINVGKVSRGYLGVMLQQDITDEIAKELGLPKGVKGAFLSKVEQGTPAAKAGLKSSDVITKINSTKVRNNSDLRNTVGLITPGKEVKVEYYRDGKKRRTEVTLGDFTSVENRMEQNAKEDELGLSLQSLSAMNANTRRSLKERFGFNSRKGLLVTEVQPGSKSESAGIQAGDILLTANRRELGSISDLRKSLRSAKKVLFKIERKGSVLYHSIRLKQKKKK